MNIQIQTAPGCQAISLSESDLIVFAESFLPFPGPAMPDGADFLDPDLPEICGDSAVYHFANGGGKADRIEMPLAVAPLIVWELDSDASSAFPFAAIRVAEQFNAAGWQVSISL